MATNQKSIEHQIGKILNDFSKSGSSWFRHSPEVVHVVNLQRSKWGKQYYINLGISILALNPALKPRTSQCHIVARLAMLTRMDPSRYVIDLEQDHPADNVENTLSALDLARRKFFDACLSINGIRRFLRTHSGIVVTKEVQAFLRNYARAT